MKISVIAKPNSKEEKIEQNEDGQYLVAVKEPPIKGKANQAIVKSLAEYFNVPKNCVEIISGLYSKNKIIEIIM